MEFLLVNHPLDCPICDQGGECDLQVCTEPNEAMGFLLGGASYSNGTVCIQALQGNPEQGLSNERA